MKHILSFSGGKDSTFLLIELIRRKYPLDEVQFFDTGWEYPEMYKHIEKCKKICEEHGILFTTLHPRWSFDHLMFDYVSRTGKKGWGWCGGVVRWGTGEKQFVLDKNALKNKDSIVYVGIAFDEVDRLTKERPPNQRFPLVEWEITEAECLKGCYDAGFDWGGLYEHLDRVSCKYCKNKSLKELRNIRKYHPDTWESLKERQRRIEKPFRGEMTVFDLDYRFEFEEERIAKGLSISDREFYRELKERLKLRKAESE